MIGLFLQWTGLALFFAGIMVDGGRPYVQIFPVGHRCANVVPSSWDAWTTQCYYGRDHRISFYLLIAGLLMIGAGKVIARRAGLD